MDKICQKCGDKGFSEDVIYCTQCWDVVEHIYCLGLSCNGISEGFSWMCDSCKSADELLAKMIVYGNKPNEMSKTSGLTLADGGNIPIVGPIWRGAFDTIRCYHGSLKAMEAFMPRTSYLTVVIIVQSMQHSLYFHMKKRCEVWPRNFDEIGAADSDIDLYIFLEFSRSEKDYNNLVEDMIADDLAMTTNLLAGIELRVFTSLEIAALEKHKIEGKYYLWGALMQKSSENSSKPCKSSAVRRRIGKGSKTVIRLKKPSNKSTQWTKLKKTISLTTPLMRSDRIPSLRSECKRARNRMPRSKRGKALLSK